jgi:hypothetical protein
MTLAYWGTRRTLRTAAVRTVVSVTVQGDSVVDVRVEEAPAMQLRRLAGLVDA